MTREACRGRARSRGTFITKWAADIAVSFLGLRDAEPIALNKQNGFCCPLSDWTNTMIDFEELDVERRRPIVEQLARQVGMLRQHHRADWPSLVADLQRLFADQRSALAREGIVFPQMAVIPLPSAGAVEFWRGDLDRGAIHQQVGSTCVRYPTVDMLELAVAVKAAYPGFKPEAVLRANKVRG